MQFDSKRGVVYVDNDDGMRVWVVDPNSMKIEQTITIKEAPEYMEIDNGRGRIFQAVKSTSTVQVIDPANARVVSEWTLGEVTSPHGLAEDRKAGRVFVAGRNGKLAVLDAQSGKLLSTLDIVKGSGQIAYDEALHRLYIPGAASIQLLEMHDDGGTILGSVPVALDCHRVAIDPATQDVWVAYSDRSNSYVQRFTVVR